jgi:hypothetical protein
MIIYLSLAVALVGVFIYILCGNPSGGQPSVPPSTIQMKVSECGRIMFWTGLLAFLLNSSELMKIVRG